MPTSGPFIAAAIKAQLGAIDSGVIQAKLKSEMESRGFKFVETADGKQWLEMLTQAMAETVKHVLVEVIPDPLGTAIYSELIKLSDTAGPVSPTHV